MHNELRYQAKRHAIFEKPSKEKNVKFPHLLPHFILFFYVEKEDRKSTKTC
jgi:hypothetical protein